MMQQHLEIVVMNHIVENCRVHTNKIHTYHEITTMIRELYDKHKTNFWYVEESLGMKKNEILNCKFDNKKFRKLLNFYLKEKTN